MRLKSEVTLGIGLIVGLQILLSMMAIALLTRMGPAIERILEENVYSAEAVEDMLSVLVDMQTADVEPRQEVFELALQRADDNVTEAAEAPMLAQVRRQYEDALDGDAEARAAVVDALRQVGQINRASMARADRRAKRIGQAGAWAAAMLGALALALGILIFRRLRLRLEMPVEQVRATLQQLREGNTQARCNLSLTDAPSELNQIVSDLNWMLDRDPTVSAAVRASHTRDEADVRRLLAWLLDGRGGVLVALDAGGKVLAMSRDALGVELPTLPLSASGSAGWRAQDIPGSGVVLLTGPPAEEEGGPIPPAAGGR